MDRPRPLRDPGPAGNELDALYERDPAAFERRMRDLEARGTGPSAPILLEAASGSRHPRVRALALLALTAIDPALGLPESARWAWSEPDPSLRGLAIRLLSRIDDPLAGRTLAEICEAEDDPRIVDLARRALEGRTSR